jgi:adenosylmethionine-8-amino-7-oxononanoate aminotransferase
LRQHHLVERVAELGPRILSDLRQVLGAFEMVREVRGRGFLLGVDYVDPTDGESMLPVELGVAREIDQAALSRGLIVYSTQPTVDGYAGDQTLIAPPFICSEDELDLLVERMGETVAAIERQVKSRLTRRVSRAGAATDPAQ